MGLIQFLVVIFVICLLWGLAWRYAPPPFKMIAHIVAVVLICLVLLSFAGLVSVPLR